MPCLELHTISKLSDFDTIQVDATHLTAKFMEEMGVNIVEQRPRGFQLTFDGYYISIIPSVFKENSPYSCQLSAFIDYRGIGPENYHNDELVKIVNEINSTMSAVKVFIYKDGDLTFNLTLSFDYNLEAKLLLKWLQQITRTMRVIREDHFERLHPYFRK